MADITRLFNRLEGRRFAPSCSTKHTGRRVSSRRHLGTLLPTPPHSAFIGTSQQDGTMFCAPDIAAPKIPYGRADFRGIRLDGNLYVDKTRFVCRLEYHNYVLFIRPQRFGKTC